MDLAVRKQAGGRHHWRGQVIELGYVIRGRLGIIDSASRAEQHLQCLPTRRQGYIDSDGGEIGLKGRDRIACGDMAMSSLLVQAAVAGMQSLALRQRRQCPGNLIQIALTDGDKIQHVAIVRHAPEQHLRSGKRSGEL